MQNEYQWNRIKRYIEYIRNLSKLDSPLFSDSEMRQIELKIDDFGVFLKEKYLGTN